MSIFDKNLVTNELPPEVIGEQKCKELANFLASKIFDHPEEFRPVVVGNGIATGLSQDPADIFYHEYKQILRNENTSKYERFWFCIPSMTLVEQGELANKHLIECPIEYTENETTYPNEKKTTKFVEFEIWLPRYISITKAIYEYI